MIFPRVVESERAQRLRGPQASSTPRTWSARSGCYALAYHVHTELRTATPRRSTPTFMVDAHRARSAAGASLHHTAASKGTGKSQYSGSTELGTDSATRL